MPILPNVFTAQVGEAPTSGGRRASAEDFAGTDFTGLGKTVRGAAETFVSELDDRETRSAVVASSEIRAKYAKELDDAVLSGAELDPIKERMNADLAEISQNFQTKRGTESVQIYTANANLMFNEQANAVAVKRASATARLEGSKLLNSESAIVIRNPAYLAIAEKNADAFAATLSGVSPEFRAEIADGLKKELNQAAAISAARTDPAGTKQRLENGEWNLTPEGRATAYGRAEQEERMAKAEASRLKAEARQEKQDADQKAYDGHLKNLLDNKGGKSWRRAVMDDPALEPRTREHLILLSEARAKEAAGGERRDNQTVLRDLWSQAASGQMLTNDKVIAAVQSGQLTVHSASFLSNVIAGQKDENGRTFTSRLQQRMSVVNGAMRAAPQYAAQPELASAIQMEMVSQVERKSAELRKEGKSPDVLLDPESKEYFFTPNRIKATEADIRARMAPQVPTAKTREELNALPDGAQYIGPDGLLATKRGATPAAPKAQSDFQAWVTATGGALKPGQTQQQAIAEWKAAR